MLFKKQAVHDAWAAAKRTLDFKVVVKGKSYTATDISTLSYDSGAMNGEALTLGSTYTNTIKITFSHLIEDLALLDEITPQIGIQLPDGTWDFTSLGLFIIDAEVQQDRNNNTTTVSASDRMCMMGGTYESKLSYPAAINDIAVEIADMSGMKVNVDDFARLPTEKILSLGKVTYRDAIGYVAQFAGGFATFDRDGLLDIRVLSDPNFTVTPDQYQSKGLTKNEAFYRIGGLTCSVTTTVKDDSGSETQETTTLQSGSTAGTQIILNNPGMTQVLLDGLYEQLQDMNFYPFSLNWFGDPSLEAGDWITVQDTAGNEFRTPNLLYSLTFGGGVTATSKADTTITASANFVYRGATNQIITNIRRYLNAAGHAVSEGIDEPTSPKAGDIWFKKEGPDTTIMTYVIDQETGVGSWHEGPSTKVNAELQKLFEDLKEEMENTSAAASAAAIAGSAAMVAGNQASAAGSAAQSAANSVAAKVVESSKEVAAAKSAANSAVDQANLAISQTGFANDAADQAKSAAASAKSDAAGALAEATKSFNDAQNAISNATKAMDAAEQNHTTVTGLVTKVDDITGTIQTLATTQSVDKLAGTVTTVQNLAQFASDGLKLKADSSTVSSLDGRVTKLSGQLDVQADKIAATVTANDVTGMLNGYATQSWSQGQISAAKNEITASVETVKNTVDNLQIGGRNYFLNSDFSQDKSNWGDNDNVWFLSNETFNGYKVMTVTPTADWPGGGSYGLYQSVKSLANTQVTISFWAKTDKNGAVFHSEPNGGNGYINFNLTINWQRYAYTGKTDSSGTIWFMPVNANTQYWLALPQIEIGNKVSDWKLAQENMATRDWTRSELTVSEGKIAANVQTLTSDMATQTWTQGKLDLTADGLTSQISSVQNGLNEKYTSIEETLKGVQVTANNAVTQSQYTQLADQITSVIGDLDNLIIGGDFEDQRAYLGKQSPYWSGIHSVADNEDKVIGNNPSATVLHIPGLLTGNNDVTSKNLVAVRQAEYNISLKTRWLSATQLGAIIIYAFECDANKNLIAPKVIAQDTKPTAWHTVTGTYTPSSDKVRYIKFNVTYAGAQGTTPIYVDDIRMELNVAAQSQITQLQSDINLRVKTGDLVSQIDVNAKRILLDGASTYITNTTHIDTGVIKSANIQDAAITSAKIGALAVTTANIGYAAVTNAEIAALAVGTAQIADGAITNAKIGNASITTAKIGDAQISSAKIISISADKITAGTLDAAKVNVVNLNASNITTGTISGANLSINLTTGQVVFQRGRIHSASDNVDINVDQGYMSVANGNARVMLKNGGIQFVQPNVFDVSTNPYLSISNGGSGLVYTGARIVGRDYVVLSNSANASNIFDQVIDGAETFAGISMGYDGLKWHPTKIGGAERGIILSAGQPLSSNVSVIGSSASITIGTKGQGAWGGNRIELTGEYVHSLSTYTKTSSGSANVIVSQDGALVRSTSAAKYKTDIQRTMDDDYGQKLLDLPTATWLDKADMKRYSDDPINQPVPTRNFGMIAEDLAAAGLEYLVVRGADGQLEGIEYDRIGPALIPVIAKLQKRIEILEQLKGEI